MNLILALDIGTTGTKAALVNREGHILATGFADYPTYHSAGNVVEQEPEAWWRATCTALAQIWQTAPKDAAAQVAAVSLSGQMQDLILLGADGAIGRAILYSDCRAQEEAAFVTQTLGQETLERITGNEQGPASLLAKWLWLQKYAPDQLAACRKILVGAHEYVGWRLHGAAGADYTTAATTGLLDLTRNRWSFDVLTALGLDADKLPGLHAATSVVGEVTTTAAALTGIPAGTPVLRGAGDLAATTIGVGAGEPGRLYGYLGTSGWVAASLDQAMPNPRGGVFTLRHPDPQRYIQVAPMLTAGGNLDWFRAEVAGSVGQGAGGKEQGVSYETLNAQAASSRLGSGGLIYLPYLAGERSPFSDPQARGAFIGLSTTTTQADMARAVMEGVALAYRSLCMALNLPLGGALYLVGGGAKSPVWPQILADVLGCEVQVVAAPGDAAARGAAILAGIELGWWSSFAPDRSFFPVSQVFIPDERQRSLYDGLYAVFQTLYPQLRGAFAELAALRLR
ncbi:MAG: FGGY-family carbohydrate kinase [Caldilineaceae bacterium]